jgi:5-methylcytosine-specific restriction endonuclease McrA
MDIAVYGDVHIHTAETKKEVNLHTIRTSNAVSTAKKKVKERDVVCQCCGEFFEIMECHHIFPVANYPDLAADTNNVILLCQSCHARYHNRYEIDDVNPLTFTEFIRNNGKEISNCQTE